jgi:hypothetical protein
MPYLLYALLALLVSAGICWLVVIWIGKSGSPVWILALLPVAWVLGSLVAAYFFNKMFGLILVKAEDHFWWGLASLVFFALLSWYMSFWSSTTERKMSMRVYNLIEYATLYVISWGAVFTAVPFARGMNLQWDLPGWVTVVGGIVAFIIAAIVSYFCMEFGDPADPVDRYPIY